MKTPVIICLCVLLGALAVSAERTIRGRLRPVAEALAPDSVSVPACAMLRGDSVALDVRGYDKPLRSARETFFVINNDSVRNVEAMWVTITYFDMENRMLHRRSERVAEPVPAAETRRVSLRSWDMQRAFYYHLSEPPARSAGTPYRVAVAVDSVLVNPAM